MFMHDLPGLLIEIIDKTCALMKKKFRVSRMFFFCFFFARRISNENFFFFSVGFPMSKKNI